MQDAEEINSQTEIKPDVSCKRGFYVQQSQGFSLNFYLASSQTRSIQQMSLHSNSKLNSKQLPRLAEKRTAHLTAVPSHATWVLKNQTLNSLLCLNSHRLKYCWIPLLSNPEYQLCVLLSTPLTSTRQATVLQPNHRGLTHRVVWTRLRT